MRIQERNIQKLHRRLNGTRKILVKENNRKDSKTTPIIPMMFENLFTSYSYYGNHKHIKKLLEEYTSVGQFYVKKTDVEKLSTLRFSAK